MAVLSSEGVEFETSVPVVIIGAGACGMTAALTVADAGVEVLVLERDSVPQGSTALSSGMIPACETHIQKAHGVKDTVDAMTTDILSKAHNATDADMVKVLCQESGPAINWLTGTHGVELALVDGFLYPNHSYLRMHAPASRTGADLIGSMTQAVERAGVDLLTDSTVTDLFADTTGHISGIRFTRPDGTIELLGCSALILACNGFGGNPEMVKQLIPDMADANYFGHTGNQGEAIQWGEALGAAMADLGSYQGHGSVAHPHGILISWALMMNGGIQVNIHGQRFSNEHQGYSEQGRRVIAEPESIAWNILDARLYKMGQGFEDFRQAVSAGALIKADTLSELANKCGLPEDSLAATLSENSELSSGQGTDSFGRDFTSKPHLQPPYYAVKVTGSLFHTQGGLVVDANARVLRPDNSPLPNLYAGGGAARGISGPSDWGYLSGNGLLTAVALGRIAGCSAVGLCSD
ncbi:MAG: FAD-dependent oxidoreductase [Rhodospirillales bacterium]|jgi:fumarate reductase flavoprotein subunit|tara:strand:+ start:605 stop:2002 length:1398 start_codon:yes stop_codon:yes gene_type:complete